VDIADVHDLIEKVAEEAKADDTLDYHWGAAAEKLKQEGWRVIAPNTPEVTVESVFPEELPDAAVLSRSEFCALLHDLLHSVEHGDSLEGNIQYEVADHQGSYRVKGAYRIGNREGQGGVRLVNADSPPGG
jgi:hypothetical protein